MVNGKCSMVLKHKCRFSTGVWKWFALVLLGSNGKICVKYEGYLSCQEIMCRLWESNIRVTQNAIKAKLLSKPETCSLRRA